MKTRFRFSAICLLLFLLSVFGGIGLILLSSIIIDNKQTSNHIWFISILFSLIFLFGIISIIWVGLKIYIDEENQKIIFKYPFRFKQYQYNFDEILGFQYSYTSTRYVDYKILKFKSKTDKKTFAISDFETKNLRDLEKLALNNFDLHRSAYWKKLNNLGKQKEIDISKQFDFEQAKKIRTNLIFLLLLTIFCIVLIISSNQNEKTEKFFYVFTVIVVFLFVKTVDKLNRVTKFIKKTIIERENIINE